MKCIGIIPARYESTRFPGKPLALLAGKPVLEHVYRQAEAAGLDGVAVATDDDRIREAVEAFGGNVVMTRGNCRCGTERACDACIALGVTPDIVINVQADEPFIRAAQIRALRECIESSQAEIATLVSRFDPARGFEALFDPNTTKVVRDDAGHALWFSRSIVPYVRKYKWTEWLSHAEFFTHMGVYAYRWPVLEHVAALPPSSLEMAESLEQLRWLQNGYKITTILTDSAGVSIDTPADLEKANEIMMKGAQHDC